MEEIYLNMNHNKRALSHYRIKPEYVLNANEIVKKEFGPKWLDLLCLKYKQGSINSISSFHPIYHGLLGKTVNEKTLEVIELTTYIKFIRKSIINAESILPRIISELKSEEKFYSYLFQLMITARLSLFLQNGYMEPIIDSIQPDISFMDSSNEYIFEITRPGLPEKTKRLYNLLERIFFWVHGKHKLDKLDLRISIKTLELFKFKDELKKSLLKIWSSQSSIIEGQHFDIIKYKFDGSVEEFKEKHMPMVQQGKGLAFATCKLMFMPFPQEDKYNYIKPKTTLVADFASIEEDLQKNVADKIDIAINEKTNKLKNISNDRRLIYIVIDIGDILPLKPLDMNRIIPRIRANIFKKYNNVIKCVAIGRRIWDNSLNRYLLDMVGIASPNDNNIITSSIFDKLSRTEKYNDFIDIVVGWGENDDDICSCKSGKSYKYCCKNILPLINRPFLYNC